MKGSFSHVQHKVGDEIAEAYKVEALFFTADGLQNS
jgi:hypothetical protein